jgi:hypothetical protein
MYNFVPEVGKGNNCLRNQKQSIGHDMYDSRAEVVILLIFVSFPCHPINSYIIAFYSLSMIMKLFLYSFINPKRHYIYLEIHLVVIDEATPFPN